MFSAAYSWSAQYLKDQNVQTVDGKLHDGLEVQPLQEGKVDAERMATGQSAESAGSQSTTDYLLYIFGATMPK